MLRPEKDWNDQGNPGTAQRLVRWPDYTAVYANEAHPGVVRFRYKYGDRSTGNNYALGDFSVSYDVEPGLWLPFLQGTAPVELILDSLLERHPDLTPLLQHILTGVSPPKRPTVPEVLPMIQGLFARHAAGCCLHSVLEEGNVRDADVDFCIAWAEKAGHVVCADLGRTLRRMSKTQRGKLANLAHG